MRHALISLVTVAASFAASRAVAAPSAPSAAELCALALQNRPTEQLQERMTCTIESEHAFPKGSPLRRAVILRLPLDSGVDQVLMIETAAKPSTWVDQGVVSRSVPPGTGELMRESGTLDGVAVHARKSGAVLEVVSSWQREVDDLRGVAVSSWRERLWCGFTKEVVCIAVPDRLNVSSRGDVPGLVPTAWTRTVSLSDTGDIAIGDKVGEGELSLGDPGPGSHSPASLADRPFVRRYPMIPLVHPDQVDPDGLPVP